MGCSCTKSLNVSNENNTVFHTESLQSKIKGMENIYNLYDAIRKKDFQEAQKWILNGTDVNCINYIGGTPLIETCRSKCKSSKTEMENFVLFLLQNGADTTRTDIYGWDALLYAEENGLKSIAAILKYEQRPKRRLRNKEDIKFSITVRISVETSSFHDSSNRTTSN